MKRVDYVIRTRILFFDKFYINLLMGRLNEHKRLTLQSLREKLCAVILKKIDAPETADESSFRGEKLIRFLYINYREELLRIIAETLEKDYNGGLFINNVCINKEETVLEFLKYYHNANK